jgi:L,D-transpeptidase catalytic domain/Putative peptidoglycan binding domain
MRRARIGLAGTCLALAGLAAASLLAGTSLGSGVTESTSTLTVAPAPPPRLKPGDLERIADGVTVGGVYVGGLEPDVAEEVVRAAFDSSLVLLVRDRRVRVSPQALGARARVKGAIARARVARPRAAVRLVVTVPAAPVRRYAKKLVAAYSRKQIDAHVVLRGLKPEILPGHAGLLIDRRATLTAIVRALQQNRRGPIVVPSRLLPPAHTVSDFGAVIVIRRGSNKLYLYRGTKYWRQFSVATGQAAYPTPLGHFSIAVKWRNPWWYPPPSPWAQGLKPVPPGPGNPLGTRWMGLTAPAVGIHGTPDAASLGYSASHGCIRMAIPSAEWLFEHVEIGTPVFIVPV